VVASVDLLRVLLSLDEAFSILRFFSLRLLPDSLLLRQVVHGFDHVMQSWLSLLDRK
jgi:hypothetical protein